MSDSFELYTPTLSGSGEAGATACPYVWPEDTSRVIRSQASLPGQASQSARGRGGATPLLIQAKSSSVVSRESSTVI